MSGTDRLEKCANGCDRPPKPPSLVICGECMDRITRTLEGVLASMTARSVRERLSRDLSHKGHPGDPELLR